MLIKLEGIEEKYEKALEIKRDVVMLWHNKAQPYSNSSEEERYRKYLDTIDDYTILHDYECSFRNQVRDLRNKSAIETKTSSSYERKTVTFERK